MLLIGSHVGFNKDTQLLGSVEEAMSYGATTFMFYTGAPQNTRRSEIRDDLTLQAMEKMKNSDIDYRYVVVHAPYIINLANNNEHEKYQFSINFLLEEIKRCEALGIHYMVLHPGSHVGIGVDAGIYNIANALNKVLSGRDEHVTILLETMAGKGTEIGSKLEEIEKIISLVEEQDRIGVCLDTCHLHDAGYDMDHFDEFLDLFDSIIGLDKVHCVHVNDSKNPVVSHKDRHENIGFGDLGFDTLCKIIYHPKLEMIPKILETPYVDGIYAPYGKEIEMIRSKTFNPNLIEEIRTQKKD